MYRVNVRVVVFSRFRKQNMKNIVLLVENDDTIRTTFTTILRHLNNEVVEAVNGEMALEKMECQTDFNFVITDIDMDVVTGFEVLEAAREKIPTARRILMSGRMGDDVKPQAAASGAQYTFVKTDFMKAFADNGLLPKQPELAAA